MGTAKIIQPDSAGLRLAARTLRGDAVCAFPTETVYGLGANALSEAAISEVYRLKGRPAWNPLIVHVSRTEAARPWAREWPDGAEALARRFWPGPLTLVLRRAPEMPGYVSAGTDTVAIRVPLHPVARALLQACELPLAAPSANRSEQLSPTRAEHVARSLPDVPLILDGGPCQFGIESTVVDVTCSPPRILRPGALSVRHIQDVVGQVEVPAAVASAEEVRSPGAGKRHYAPRARLVVLGQLDQATLRSLPKPLGILSHQCLDDAAGTHATRVERLPADPVRYATGLYAALHHLDDGSMATIAVLAPPRDEQWAAVRDRLTRAAA